MEDFRKITTSDPAVESKNIMSEISIPECTQPDIDQLMSENYTGEKPKVIQVTTPQDRIDCIINYCLWEFTCTKEEIYEKTRRRPIVEARQVVMYFLREYTSLGLVQIGDMFKMDHSTVIHAIECVIKHCEWEPSFNGKISRINFNLKNTFNL